MAFQISKKNIARLTDGHKLLGLTLSAVLFLICMSGTIAVFFKEFERWEKPYVPEFIEYRTSSVARAALDSHAHMLNDKQRESAQVDLFIMLPNSAMPRLTAGYNDDVRAYDQEGRYIGSARHDNTHFLSHLHYYLHLPESVGMIVVSILGIFMLALLIGGAFSHRKIFVDAFRLRSRDKGHLGRTDLHNRIGTWTLPFTLVVTATGSFIGFSQVVVFLVATLFYNGNIGKAVEPVFGSTEQAKTHTKGLPFAGEQAIINALDELKKHRPDQVPFLLTIKDAVGSAPYLEVTTLQNQRLVYGEIYRFNERGQLMGTHQLSDGAIGKQIYASLFPLHFGSYGGIWVQCMYVFVGLALCLMIHAGMEIWFTKTANRGQAHPNLHIAWISFIYSSVSAIAITMCFGFFVSDALTRIYWGSLSLLVVLGCIAGRYFQRKITNTIWLMRSILGLSLLVLVMTHWIHFQSMSAAALWPNVCLSSIAALLLVLNFFSIKKARSEAALSKSNSEANKVSTKDQDVIKQETQLV